MIKYFTVFGLPCSGTNYIESLMLINFDIGYLKYGWKHRYIDFFDFSHKPTSISNFDELLIIIVHRNIFDWLRSYYKSPYHIPDELLKDEFSGFIRKEWWLWHDVSSGLMSGHRNYHNELMIERHPQTKDRYKDIFEMRYTKLQGYIDLIKMSKDMDLNVYIVDYDFIKLNDNYKCVLSDISNKYNLKLINEKIENIDTYNGLVTQKPYVPKIYDLFTPEDLEYIKSKIQRDLENHFIYIR